jgi:hypothetical protein
MVSGVLQVPASVAVAAAISFGPSGAVSPIVQPVAGPHATASPSPCLVEGQNFGPHLGKVASCRDVSAGHHGPWPDAPGMGGDRPQAVGTAGREASHRAAGDPQGSRGDPQYSWGKLQGNQGELQGSRKELQGSREELPGSREELQGNRGKLPGIPGDREGNGPGREGLGGRIPRVQLSSEGVSASPGHPSDRVHLSQVIELRDAAELVGRVADGAAEELESSGRCSTKAGYLGEGVSNGDVAVIKSLGADRDSSHPDPLSRAGGALSTLGVLFTLGALLEPGTLSTPGTSLNSGALFTPGLIGTGNAIYSGYVIKFGSVIYSGSYWNR